MTGGQHCQAVWPSAVSGGMTDAQCPEVAALTMPWGPGAAAMHLCRGCAVALEDGD